MKKLQIVSWIACLGLMLIPTAHGYTTNCFNVEYPEDDGCDKVGSSIIPSRGEKRRNVTDLETYGVAPIAFTRLYNSRTTDFTTNYIDFGWRQTWQHNWNYEVRDLESKTYDQNDIKVRYPSGNEFNFKAADSNGMIRVPPAFHGDRLYKWSGSPVGHTLVTPDGWEYDFQRTTSPRYQLVRVRNGQGLTWTLSYDGQGKLHRIANDFGRWIEIDRGVTNNVLLITSVRSSDGREVTYDYSPWVNTTTNFVLSGVNYPDGSRAEYTYVGAQSAMTGRPLVSTANDPKHPGAGARISLVYNYNFIFDFGNGPYLITGVAKEERNLDTDALVVTLPFGSGPYPQILQGDGAEITRKYTGSVLVEKRDAEDRPTYYTRDQGGEGFIASETDANGATITYERDFAGRILQETDPLGHTNNFTYNSAGFVTNQTDKLGFTTAYTRNTNNLPTRIDYPDGTFVEWTYNQFGQPLIHLRRTGGTETFSYYGTNELGGLFGDLKINTNTLGGVTTYTWSLAGLMTSLTDVRSNTTSFAYDWRGNLLCQTNADHTVVAFEYDAFGNRTNTVDELGNLTEYTYDEFNRLKTVRDPLGHVAAYEYGLTPGCGGCGAMGNTITKITDPAGNITEYTYDHSGKRLSETIDAGTSDASTNTWTYDSVGRLAGSVDANGIAEDHQYDAAGRLVGKMRNGQLVQSNRYNAAGWIVWQQDANGLVTSNTYDNVGRQLRTYLPDGMYYENEYDSTFLSVSHDRAGRSTTYYRDIMGRVTNQVDNAANSVRFAYDASGNLVDLWDQKGNLTRFEYDVKGRQTTKIYADNSQYIYTYNAAGRLLSKLDAKGSTTTYSYDPVGNLTNIDYESDASVAFDYDVLSRITKMMDGVGTTLWTYNGSGGKASSVDGPFANDTLYYGYDRGKRLVSITSAYSTVEYVFDDLDRITGVISENQTNFYSYLGNSRRPVLLTRGNGTKTIYEYDSLNRLTNLVNETSTGTVISSYAYTLSDADERTQVIIGAGTPSSRTINYTSDPIGQLISAQSPQPGHSFNYDYDPAGNPTRQDNNGFIVNNAFNNLNQNITNSWLGSVTVQGVVNITNGSVSVNGQTAPIFSGRTFVATNLSVETGSNTYTALITDPFGRASTSRVSVVAENAQFGYDANGNMTNDGQFAYVWDNADRLTEVRQGNEVVMTCKYDGFSRRRERVMWTEGIGFTNRYVYHNWNVMAVLDDGNFVIEKYVRSPDLSGTLDGVGGIGGILSCSVGSTSLFFHYDGSGNVVSLTDSNQIRVCSIEYSPFGKVLTRSGSVIPRQLFSSKEWDNTARLYYYGLRFHSPAMGRWISRDPIGERGGMNLYGFVKNIPVSMVDFIGLDCRPYLEIDFYKSSLGAAPADLIMPELGWLIDLIGYAQHAMSLMPTLIAQRTEFIDVPHCYIVLSVHQKKRPSYDGWDFGPEIIGGGNEPSVFYSINIYYHMTREYVYGPNPKDPCCKNQGPGIPCGNPFPAPGLLH